MKIIRWILGKIILLLDWLFAPRSLQRAAEIQAQIDAQTESLTLYQYLACPFCVKVRRAMKRLNLAIATRDVRDNVKWEQQLVTQGGERKVPCLRIEESPGQYRWLYESTDIVNYLEQRFSGV